MNWTSYDTWMLVIAALAAVNCALLGNFLLLRKLSMMGDAISHAVLPGLAVALLIAGTLHPTAMFLGAAVVGVLTAVLVQFVHRGGQVDEGASMGVVFTSLFAVGLILIRRVADEAHIDLDPDCVLFGQLADAALDRSWVSGLASFFPGGYVPRSALVLGVMLLVNLGFVVGLFKELRITAFDPALADTLGIRSGLMHYATMTLVAMTAVAAFESVGSILVVALLIVPPATAFLVTRRLGVMVLLSATFAFVAAALGHMASTTIPARFAHDGFNPAGMIAVVAGLMFAGVLFFEPQRGVLTHAIRRWNAAVRVAEEDVLAVLYRREESGDLSPVRPRNTLGLAGYFARRRLVRADRAHWEADLLVLNDAGRPRAEKLVRSHRLWERYMADRVGVRPDHTHAPAETLEHVTDEEMQQRLAAETPARVDPHGKPIPQVASSE